MATSQLDLIELLRAIDPEAPLAERHLWLMQLLDWVRGDTQDPDMAVARVRMLIDAAEVRPDWLKLWQHWWEEFLTTMDATPLLADLGFAPQDSFTSELGHRLQRKLMPPTPETTDLSELFPLLFPTEFDGRWLRALDARTLTRLRTVLFRAAPDAPPPNVNDYAIRTLLDAMMFAVTQICAIGHSAPVRTRMSADAKRDRAFAVLPQAFLAVREAVQAHGRASAPAVIAIGQLREQLDACRAAAQTVYIHLEEHGISVQIEFQLRQLRQRIIRMKALLLCLETDVPVQATTQLLSHLVRVDHESRSMRELMSDSTELLAAKVTERNAETGQHYITRDASEYLHMLGAAAGGGAVLAGTTWIKLLIGAVGLTAFWGGLAAGINYAVCFVFIMLMHWTVATKQPAMTAPAMAAKLRDINAPGATDQFLDEVGHLLRSQFAAILGNVGVVMPVVIGIAIAVESAGHHTVMDHRHALQTLSNHQVLGPTALFAAATGGLLFLSSLVAGWVENWFVFHRLDSVITYHPRITRRLGAERARRWGTYWRQNISGYAANISLGLMLGLVPPFLGFFGIPFEVRHVTLVAGQIAAAAHELGPQVIHRPAFWGAVGGIAITGLMNVSFSFWLAFRLALTAQGIGTVNRKRLYAALRRRMLRQPLSFVLPVRLNPRPHTATEPAPPAASQTAPPDSQPTDPTQPSG
ncbi:site-specific recombinase [Ottowia oryzae]|uniref:Recombinase n=1 Tax=Ottowia oryzae TaxID=2109914 RepID=A0A2S0MB34_9BURK|nr:site-specific recombinase [Ottowia oryzae]AVO33112.1 recombinase [Ottowia oryzae]